MNATGIESMRSLDVNKKNKKKLDRIVNGAHLGNLGGSIYSMSNYDSHGGAIFGGTILGAMGGYAYDKIKSGQNTSKRVRR